jgi:hypothetical protein
MLHSSLNRFHPGEVHGEDLSYGVELSLQLFQLFLDVHDWSAEIAAAITIMPVTSASAWRHS